MIQKTLNSYCTQICFHKYDFRLLKKYVESEFPGGSVGEGSGGVTAVALITAVAQV